MTEQFKHTDEIILLEYIETNNDRLLLQLEPILKQFIINIMRWKFNYNNSLEEYILIDIFTGLVIRLDKFDATRGSIFNFMTTVTLNLLRNYFAKFNRVQGKEIALPDEFVYNINKCSF